MSRLIKSLSAIGLCFASLATVAAQTSEQTTTARDRQSVNITVYNSNLGLVRETRRLTLPNGQIALRFADVTAQIRPETVHLSSLTAPAALRILEQNYQYDLLNPAKLLDKFVGKEITLVLRRYQNNTESFEPVQATLLSNNGGQVWRINGQIVINPSNIAEMRFPDLPKNLVATPTLVWDLENRETGPQSIEASYLTGGMNWRADYVLLVNADDTKGDLQGWVTLTNASGATFEDARLQLVAGNVNRVSEERNFALAGAMLRKEADSVSQFQEQGFFEYHMYTLQRPATIRDNETKQVSLLEAAGFDVKKEFVLNGQRYYYTGYNNPGAAIKEKVGVYVQFRNSQTNKLGMPLPAGTIRLYKKDDKGNQQFIGEDKIDHTPKDEDVRVKVGDAFDIVAERRKQTDYRVVVTGHMYEYAYEIKIRNHKDGPVTVVVNEPIGGDWEMVSSTFKAEKTAAFAAQFQVPVAKDGEATLAYRVRVKY